MTLLEALNTEKVIFKVNSEQARMIALIIGDSQNVADQAKYCLVDHNKRIVLVRNEKSIGDREVEDTHFTMIDITETSCSNFAHNERRKLTLNEALNTTSVIFNVTERQANYVAFITGDTEIEDAYEVVVSFNGNVGGQLCSAAWEGAKRETIDIIGEVPELRVRQFDLKKYHHAVKTRTGRVMTRDLNDVALIIKHGDNKLSATVGDEVRYYEMDGSSIDGSVKYDLVLFLNVC